MEAHQKAVFAAEIGRAVSRMSCYYNTAAHSKKLTGLDTTKPCWRMSGCVKRRLNRFIFMPVLLIPLFCQQLNGSSKRKHTVSDLDFLIWTPRGGGTVIYSFFLLFQLYCCFHRPAATIVLFQSSCCFNRPAVSIVLLFQLSCCFNRPAVSIVLLFQLSCC